jgi:hypothetical protein
VTSDDLIRYRTRHNRSRAVAGAILVMAGEVVSVIATQRLHLPVHWATVALIGICALWFAVTPIFFETFDRSFHDAWRREDLTHQANDFAERLYVERHPNVVVWTSPLAGFEGLYHQWVGREVHIVLRSEIDAMPLEARDFAVARAVDAAISSKRRGLRLLIPDWHLLLTTVAVLLSAALGEWVILGSCITFLIPMVAFMFATSGVSKRIAVNRAVKRLQTEEDSGQPRSSPKASRRVDSSWPDKRQLAVDRRAIWATGGISGARAWYTDRIAKTEGHAREVLQVRLYELENLEE